LGKEIGITCSGDESRVLKQLQEMEERDSNIKQHRKEGFKEVI